MKLETKEDGFWSIFVILQNKESLSLSMSQVLFLIFTGKGSVKKNFYKILEGVCYTKGQFLSETRFVYLKNGLQI